MTIPRSLTLPLSLLLALPSATYKLSLRNLSSKNISALQVEVFEGSRLRLSGSPHGQERLPLIPAGAVLETKVLGAKDTTMTGVGYEPASPLFQTIVVSTLVFEDGKYEKEFRQWLAATFDRYAQWRLRLR